MRLIHVAELDNKMEWEITSEQDVSDQRPVVQLIQHGPGITQRKTLLFVGFLIAFGIGLNLFSLAAIDEHTAEQLGTSSLGAKTLASITFFVPAMFGIGFAVFVREFDLKLTLQTVTILQILGSLMSYIGLSQKIPVKTLAMLSTSQLAESIAFAAFIECIPVFAALWSLETPSLVASVLFSGLYVGAGARNIWIGSSGNNIIEILKRVQATRLCIACFIIVIISLYINRPPAWSINSSSKLGRPGTAFDRVVQGIKDFHWNGNLLLLQNSYAVYFALANSTMLLLKDIIAKELPDGLKSAHWIMATTNLTGAVGIICGTIIIHTKSKEKTFSVCLIIISSIFMTAFTLAATFVKSVPLSSLLVSLWGITGCAWLVMGLKYTMDMSYRSSICVAPTLCFVAGSFYTVIITAIFDWILNAFDFAFVGYFFATLYVVSLILLVLSKNRQLMTIYQRL